MGSASSDPAAWLARNGAQRDVVLGLGELSHDWETLWTRCPRGDWMLGIAVRLGVDRVALVRAAIACARVALERAHTDETARALAVAERWSRGDASEADVADVARAVEAENARALDPPREAASRAALAACLGVADPEMLVAAASSAVEAHVLATMDRGIAAAIAAAHARCADAVRAAIPWEAVAALVG